MEVLEAIKGRRSIRSYKKDEIPLEKLNIILEAARWAPSWANTQCWEFIIVKDKDIKDKLAQTLPSVNPALPAFSQVPIVLVACAKKAKSGYFQDKPVTDKGEYWYMFDVALALQNLTLAAYSLGIGSLHVGYFDAQKAAEIVKIPSDLTVIELVLLGYPEGEPRLTKRKQINDFVFYNYYGNKIE